MKIISAWTAKRMRAERPTLMVGKFDRGKYKGKPSDYFGNEVQDIPGVIAVYPVSSRDRHGPFVALRSLSEPVHAAP